MAHLAVALQVPLNFLESLHTPVQSTQMVQGRQKRTGVPPAARPATPRAGPGPPFLGDGWCGPGATCWLEVRGPGGSLGTRAGCTVHEARATGRSGEGCGGGCSHSYPRGWGETPAGVQASRLSCCLAAACRALNCLPGCAEHMVLHPRSRLPDQRRLRGPLSEGFLGAPTPLPSLQRPPLGRFIIFLPN